MGGRKAAIALALCGALVALPLVVLRGETSAVSAASTRALPAWELAVNTSALKVSRGDVPVGGEGSPPVAPTPASTVPASTVPATTAPASTVPASASASPAPASPAPVAPVRAAAGAVVATTAPSLGPVLRVGVVSYYAHPPGTCASPFLSFGTVVTITNPANGATVTCVVDDREADTARAIDLAAATFAELAPLSQGLVTDAELRW